MRRFFLLTVLDVFWHHPGRDPAGRQPKTNAPNLFIFESPDSEGDSAWGIGNQITGQLAIDDGI
jgi:hypothetical protein